MAELPDDVIEAARRHYYGPRRRAWWVLLQMSWDALFARREEPPKFMDEAILRDLPKPGDFKPGGFVCASCGRAVYNMTHAPLCSRCRRREVKAAAKV